MYKPTRLLAGSVILAIVGTVAAAQTMHHSAMSSVGHGNSQTATEPGQGAFAALSEMVTLLSSDPQTNWSRVNIDALRDHLVDMDHLITKTAVSTRNVPGGIAIAIDLADPNNDAARRMVPAHAPVLWADTAWSSAVTQTGDTLVWTVTSDQAETQIRALGFFGLMATGDHHREHHLTLARGDMPH